MTAATPDKRTLGIYQHQKGKYQVLNPQNQTPKQYVIGQRYKVGTGIALVQISASETEKVHVIRCSYKGFLSDIFRQETAPERKVLAFKWLPKKIVRQKTITGQGCGDPCEDICKKPGCVCNVEKNTCE